MTAAEFKRTLKDELPVAGLSAPLEALWWDAKGEWERAHGLVDELESIEAMAVHAYLHRKEGAASNAEYWYRRAGRRFYREDPVGEWNALVEGIARSDKQG